MGIGYKHGAGGPSILNFKVVSGTQAPANPKENMIWVNPTSEMTGWCFAPAAPEALQEGLVWFKTGLASDTAFNCMKKNALQVYPTAARQLVDGTWVGIIARIYQQGAWKSLWDGTLYRQGDLYESVTGGWKAVNGGSSSGYISDENILYLRSASADNHSSAYTEHTVDLTGYKKLIATVSVTASPDSTDSWPNIMIANQNSAPYGAHNCVAYAGAARGSTGNFTIELNLENYQSRYYIGFWASACDFQPIDLKLQ